MFTGPLGLVVAAREVEVDPVARLATRTWMAHRPLQVDAVVVHVALGLVRRRPASAASAWRDALLGLVEDRLEAAEHRLLPYLSSSRWKRCSAMRLVPTWPLQVADHHVGRAAVGADDRLDLLEEAGRG